MHIQYSITKLTYSRIRIYMYIKSSYNCQSATSYLIFPRNCKLKFILVFSLAYEYAYACALKLVLLVVIQESLQLFELKY